MPEPDEQQLNPPLDDDDEEKLEEQEEEDESVSSEKSDLIHRLSTEKVNIRVHDVIIKGNTKTKDSLLEAEVEALKKPTDMHQLLQAASYVNARLQNLEIFDAVNITLDSGPVELPGTANVVIEVVEAKSPILGDLGIYTRPEARSCTVEGKLRLRNLFGYGDIWDGFGAYGWDQASEISTGISLPRFRGLSTPLTARISLLSQDWLKFSSYKERMLGLSLGLISTRNHDLAYNLTWRTLTDPSQMSSRSVRMQLGHHLISALKYKFTIDGRDSPMRPTRGYAFVSNTQLAGLMPDSRGLRFLRQEFDLRYAVPLGFYNTALNFGLSLGAIFPWGSGFMNKSSPISERFFLGGQSSHVCTLGGPTTLFGFKFRGLGPTELRRSRTNGGETSATTAERDVLGGDLACTVFADLSFDLPLRLLRDAGIHGHIFASAGNVAKLTENEFQNISFRRFGESFRSSAGAGIIIPTKLFRIEMNYCYILKQFEHDCGQSGIQFSFSTPL